MGEIRDVPTFSIEFLSCFEVACSFDIVILRCGEAFSAMLYSDDSCLKTKQSSMSTDYLVIYQFRGAGLDAAPAKFKTAYFKDCINIFTLQILKPSKQGQSDADTEPTHVWY